MSDTYFYIICIQAYSKGNVMCISYFAIYLICIILLILYWKKMAMAYRLQHSAYMHIRCLQFIISFPQVQTSHFTLNTILLHCSNTIKINSRQGLYYYKDHSNYTNYLILKRIYLI